MIRRKHRLAVDITLSSVVSTRQAQAALAILLAGIDTQAKPIWPSEPSIYAEKFNVIAHPIKRGPA